MEGDCVRSGSTRCPQAFPQNAGTGYSYAAGSERAVVSWFVLNSNGSSRWGRSLTTGLLMPGVVIALTRRELQHHGEATFLVILISPGSEHFV